MCGVQYIYGPSYEEMLDPNKIDQEVRQKALTAKKEDPLNAINLYNISWKDENNKIRHIVLPKELTGVEANIIVLYAKDFPTGSHKVGATYSIALEHQLKGTIIPSLDKLVWPSTGNFGVGGAWVGPRMGYESLVLLPELMSQERFDLITYYGAKYIKTPGCESNVKEIYDKSKEISESDSSYKVLNQFAEMGNYRFHYFVTGNTCAELVAELQEKGIGNGRCAAFISSMGSSGTIAAGDLLKQKFSDCRIVGLEPIQCPTLFNNGYGGHDIQGIGDKHVTWIHNVKNMDAMMCIDDIECKKGLQALSEEAGMEVLANDFKIPAETVKFMSDLFGISSICNILGAIKTAKFYEFDKNHNIITIATDSLSRYYSVMKQMTETYGKVDKTEAKVRLISIFHGAKTDWIAEGTVHNRNCWHNLKYYTWVEQQGKTVEELNAQKHQDYWIEQQSIIHELSKLLYERRSVSRCTCSCGK